MKRQHILTTALAAMLALFPLLAVAQQPATDAAPEETAPAPQDPPAEQTPTEAEAEPPATSDPAAVQNLTDADATWETENRVERAETGTLRGTVVLLDRQNLIVETEEGDRAFALDADTRLPDVLTDEEVEWNLVEGFPVEVTYRAGDPGELRIVESLSVLPVRSQESGAAAATAQTPTQATGTPQAELQTGTATAGGNATGDTATETTTDTEPTTGTTTRAAGAATLPRTASPLPWIGLIGILALGGAYALRRRSPVAADRS